MASAPQPLHRRRFPARLRMWLLRIVICVILGAITTVAVAWSLPNGAYKLGEFLKSTDVVTYRVPGDEPDNRLLGWAVTEERRFGVTSVNTFWVPDQAIWHSIEFDDIETRSIDRIHDPARLVVNRENYGGFGTAVSSGAPWSALSACLIEEGPQGGWRKEWHGLAEYEIPLLGDVTLLMLPDPIGFPIDTAFYAVLWLLIWLAVLRLRAWNRTRRGRCVACGYSLRDNTSGVCPECGSAAMSRNTVGASAS